MKKAKLQGQKTVRIFGGKYVIRKINPLLDFPYDRIPQIFSSFQSKRPVVETKPLPIQLQKNLEDMKSIVTAGIVNPVLVPIGKGDKHRRESGITVDDLFVDVELGTKLYIEILAHSLNKFRHGIIDNMRGLFFSIRIKLLLSTLWQKNLSDNLSTSYSPKEVIP